MDAEVDDVRSSQNPKIPATDIPVIVREDNISVELLNPTDDTRIGKDFLRDVKSFMDHISLLQQGDDNQFLSNKILVLLSCRKISVGRSVEHTSCKNILEVNEIERMIDAINRILKDMEELLTIPSKYVQSYVCFQLIGNIQYLFNDASNESIKYLHSKCKDSTASTYNIKKLQIEWLQDIRYLVRTLQRRNRNCSLSVLSLEATKVELLIHSIPDANAASRVIGGGLKILGGIINSFANRQFDMNIIRGVFDIAAVALSSTHRRLVKQVTDLLADMDRFATVVGIAIRNCNNISVSEIQCIEKQIVDLHNVLFVREDSVHSRLQRWEIYAAYCNMITELILHLSPLTYIRNLYLKVSLCDVYHFQFSLFFSILSDGCVAGVPILLYMIHIFLLYINFFSLSSSAKKLRCQKLKIFPGPSLVNIL